MTTSHPDLRVPSRGDLILDGLAEIRGRADGGVLAPGLRASARSGRLASLCLRGRWRTLTTETRTETGAAPAPDWKEAASPPRRFGRRLSILIWTVLGVLSGGTVAVLRCCASRDTKGSPSVLAAFGDHGNQGG
jgi:hypothetical protein